jgi:hypothetical protein
MHDMHAYASPACDIQVYISQRSITTVLLSAYHTIQTMVLRTPLLTVMFLATSTSTVAQVSQRRNAAPTDFGLI